MPVLDRPRYIAAIRSYATRNTPFLLCFHRREHTVLIWRSDCPRATAHAIPAADFLALQRNAVRLCLPMLECPSRDESEE